MSTANDTINTMELKQKCKEMSDFFLPVFEDYWMKDEPVFDGDIVEFCMYTDSLTFYLAFAVEHGMVDVSGITQAGAMDINETYDMMIEGLQEGLKK